MSSTSQSVLKLLCNLRWLAIAGQSTTVYVAAGPMHVALPTGPLWAGILLLAAFNVYATWRTRSPAEIRTFEVGMHMLVDVAVLAWLIGWSGGMENPFSSLFLLPIAVAVLALPSRWVWVTAAASVLGYGVSAVLGRALPHTHSLMGDAFGLHKIGMLVNFIVSTVVVLIFFTRIVKARRDGEQQVARMREQFTRNEGILALATHAASVVHELNTPFGTLTIMVDDMIEDAESEQQREDFVTLKALLEVCRDRVRELAVPADPELRNGIAAHVELERVIERWQLIRPTVELHRSGELAHVDKVDPAVGHLLQVLLNNAADAGEQVGVRRVDLELGQDGPLLRGAIRDYGPGFDRSPSLLPASLFGSTKPDGLGIGLALSHAAVERLGGELSMRSTDGPGVRVEFWLPLAGRS